MGQLRREQRRAGSVGRIPIPLDLTDEGVGVPEDPPQRVDEVQRAHLAVEQQLGAIAAEERKAARERGEK